MKYLISFEGIDGSGKETQLELLCKYLTEKQKSVVVRSYPAYKSFFGREIGGLLSGNSYKLNASQMDPKSMALWYALDRWHDYQENKAMFHENDYVLLNRYTLSSVVYQSLRSSEDDNFQLWVENLEHTILGLPRPSIYVVFDIIPGVAKSNVICKGKRDYIESDADVYEADSNLQIRARKLYLDISEKMPNVRVVNCCSNKSMLNKDIIFQNIINLLSNEGFL